MTKSALPFAAALWLGAFAPALAQGTDEQREACAPDAVRLCEDTIPDVEKTTACMKRKEAQLSPRCRAVFSAAIGESPASATRERRITRAAPAPERDLQERNLEPRVPRRASRPDDDDRTYRTNPYPDDVVPDGERHYRYLAPNGDEAETGEDHDVDRARAAIGRLCDEDRLDPGTCAAANNGLEYAR